MSLALIGHQAKPPNRENAGKSSLYNGAEVAELADAQDLGNSFLKMW
jgi:hypothetical protein